MANEEMVERFYQSVQCPRCAHHVSVEVRDDLSCNAVVCANCGAIAIVTRDTRPEDTEQKWRTVWAQPLSKPIDQRGGIR